MIIPPSFSWHTGLFAHTSTNLFSTASSEMPYKSILQSVSQMAVGSPSVDTGAGESTLRKGFPALVKFLCQERGFTVSEKLLWSQQRQKVDTPCIACWHPVLINCTSKYVSYYQHVLISCTLLGVPPNFQNRGICTI